MKSLFTLAALTFGLFVTEAQAVNCCQPLAPYSMNGCLERRNASSCMGRSEVVGYCDFNGCVADKSAADFTSDLDSDVENDSDSDLKTEMFYGFIEGYNKSGNGRTQSAKAKLDACFTGGYSKVDTFGGRSSCYSGCNSSDNYSCWTSGSPSVCYSRCDGVYASGT